MTAFEFGDVVIVRFPFTDQSTGQQRPAVVISSEAYHRARPDILIIAITSQTPPRAVVPAGLGPCPGDAWIQIPSEETR